MFVNKKEDSNRVTHPHPLTKGGTALHCTAWCRPAGTIAQAFARSSGLKAWTMTLSNATHLTTSHATMPLSHATVDKTA